MAIMRLNQLISKLHTLQSRIGGEATVFINVEGSSLEFIDVVSVEDNDELLQEFGLSAAAVAAIICTESIANLGYEVVAIDDSEEDVEDDWDCD